ncbi:hypothetical protein NpPPO83_00000389 [Neofusicoccum parvum]|uniref:Uncharacterized protein n=1 Tax=Neofusicoccum parvum TaxID=310453 RepID=A0ACB5SQ35_9PEZI|nr:hypothetical protein NpPPO83_00000389 [Neofusicoccum parvum]
MPPRPRPSTKHPSPSQPSGPPTTAPPRRPNRNPRKRRHHRRRCSASPRAAAAAASEPDDSGPGDLYVPVELAALGPFGVFFLPADEQGGREGEGGGAEEMVGEREEQQEQEGQEEEGDELPDIVTGEVNAPGFMVFARERRATEKEVAGDLAEHRKSHGEVSGLSVEE